MHKKLMVIVMILVKTVLSVTVAYALDFYGADVTDQDAPSSFMKYGIYGYHPTIASVTMDSPADGAGFRQGDIVLLINDKKVKRTSELSSFTTDTINLLVLSGNERKTLRISRAAIEAKKAALKAAEAKAAIALPSNHYADEQPDKSPALKFDNAILDKKYGKTSPQQLAMEAQRASAEDKRYRKEMGAREQEESRKTESKRQREEDQKQTRVNCNTSSECGTGRVCGILLFNRSASTGRCMTDAEYNRLEDRVDQASRDRQQQFRDSQQQMQNTELGNRLDNIDRKLRGF